MLICAFLMFVQLFSSPAQAVTWNATTATWALKAYGPIDLGGQVTEFKLDGCPVNASWTAGSWGCPAADAGQIYEAKRLDGTRWLQADGVTPYLTCNTGMATDSTGKSVIYVFGVFDGGVDANHFPLWPMDSSWPTSAKCTRSLTGGVTHSYTIPIGMAPTSTRLFTPISTIQITFAGGGSVTLPAIWNNAGSKVFNLPDGAYTGPSTSDFVNARNAANTADYPWVKCMVGSSTNDLLKVALNENATDGTAYCPLTYGGVDKLVPFLVSSP